MRHAKPVTEGHRGSVRDAFAVTITELANERTDIVLLDGDNASSSQTEMFAKPSKQLTSALTDA